MREKRLIDANALLGFAEFDARVIAPDKHTAKDILDMVKTAPTVDAVEVVHGAWKLKSEIRKMFDDVDEKFYVECPLCGRTFWGPFEVDEGKMISYAKEKYPYCNCGAKMDGKGE